jgi:Protein of unknown function (DUF664)
MTWTAPEITRPARPGVADERTMLEAWLDFHRQTLLMKCTGLSAEQLKRRSAAPSTLTLHGLVRHMAEVERDWFRLCFAGQNLSYLYGTEAWPNADFDDLESADPATDFATFVEEVRLARAATVGRARRHVRAPAMGHGDQSALGLCPHDRGIRPAQRPCGPAPRAHRRGHRSAVGRGVSTVQGAGAGAGALPGAAHGGQGGRALSGGGARLTRSIQHEFHWSRKEVHQQQ